MSKTWSNGKWIETPTSPELAEFAQRPIGEPDPLDSSIMPGGLSNPDNTVPSDFGKLRKMYGNEIAEMIEIEDDIAHAGDY